MNRPVEQFVYLASPYSHESEMVREKRFIQITEIGAKLAKAGLNLYCPITQSVMLNRHMENKDDVLTHDECMRIDLAFLSRASAIIVVAMDGWRESKGVAEEMEFAKANGIKVFLMDPDPDYLLSFNDTVDRVKRHLSNGGVTNYDKPEVIGERTIKGASKAGKPNVLNFPWGSLKEGDGDYMPSIIKASANNDRLSIRAYAYGIFYKMDVSYLDINQVFESGISKHGLQSHRNYELEDVDDIINAMGRHILKGLDNIDEESGFPHRLHVAANALMIIQIINLNGGSDE